MSIPMTPPAKPQSKLSIPALLLVIFGGLLTIFPWPNYVSDGFRYGIFEVFRQLRMHLADADWFLDELGFVFYGLLVLKTLLHLVLPVLAIVVGALNLQGARRRNLFVIVAAVGAVRLVGEFLMYIAYGLNSERDFPNVFEWFYIWPFQFFLLANTILLGTLITVVAFLGWQQKPATAAAPNPFMPQMPMPGVAPMPSVAPMQGTPDTTVTMPTPPTPPATPPMPAAPAPQPPGGAPFRIYIPGMAAMDVDANGLRMLAASRTIQPTTSVEEVATGRTYLVQQIPGVFSDKSYTAAIVISFFFGYLGIDRFYLGYTGLGIAKLLTLGGCGIWALIDFILIIARKVNDAQGRLLA